MFGAGIRRAGGPTREAARLVRKPPRRSLGTRLIHLLTALVLLGAAAAQAETVAGDIPGEFAVDETGAATYTIPIQVPPGVAGMEPSLALVYNSRAGNGLLGVGWSLSGLSVIHRCPKTFAQDGVRGGINYDADDRFCLDGQRLIAIEGAYGANGTEYRTEVDTFTQDRLLRQRQQRPGLIQGLDQVGAGNRVR